MVLRLPWWLNGKESASNAETRILPLGREDPLEKEMATLSSILGCPSHGQRSLVGYSPWSRKKVRHDLATKTTTMVLRNQQISHFFFISHDKSMKAVHNVWNYFHTPSCAGGKEKRAQGALKITM